MANYSEDEPFHLFSSLSIRDQASSLEDEKTAFENDSLYAENEFDDTYSKVVDADNARVSEWYANNGETTDRSEEDLSKEEIEARRKQILQYLVETDVDLRLHEAVAAGQLHQVEVLLNEKPPLAKVRDSHGNTPLHLARSQEMVRLLINACPKNAQNKFGRTAIIEIARRYDYAAYRALLSCGCDIDVEDNEDCNLFDYIKAFDELSYFDALFEIIGATDSELLYILLRASRQSEFCAFQEYLPILTDRNAVFQRNGREGTVLDIALDCNQLPLALAAAQAANNAGLDMISATLITKDEQILSKCSQLNYFAGIRHLVSIGANVNARDYLKRTALHWAAKHHHLSVVEYLLQNGADINAIDYNGDTALSLAFDNENYADDLYDLLISSGADPNIPAAKST